MRLFHSRGNDGRNAMFVDDLSYLTSDGDDVSVEKINESM